MCDRCPQIERRHRFGRLGSFWQQFLATEWPLGQAVSQSRGNSGSAWERAHRCLLQIDQSMRRKGWVFALFPSGTRMRPGDESSKEAIAETDSYLRAFDNVVLCHISGCTLPVSKDQDFVHEVPQLDRMVYTFGPVQRTDQWRNEMAERFPDLDHRAASAKGIEEAIEALAPNPLQ